MHRQQHSSGQQVRSEQRHMCKCETVEVVVEPHTTHTCLAAVGTMGRYAFANSGVHSMSKMQLSWMASLPSRNENADSFRTSNVRAAQPGAVCQLSRLSPEARMRQVYHSGISSDFPQSEVRAATGWAGIAISVLFCLHMLLKTQPMSLRQTASPADNFCLCRRVSNSPSAWDPQSGSQCVVPGAIW